jgi:serine/threonine-protein kinase SRPK3
MPIKRLIRICVSQLFPRAALHCNGVPLCPPLGLPAADGVLAPDCAPGVQRRVALKIQKSARHYTEAAMDEIALLRQVAEGDRADCKGVVKLVDHFQHAGPHGQHVCMVFEYLGDNLLTLIKRYHYRGLPLPMVRQLAQHILGGLDFLHRECQIIHTDLKPENVLLVQPIDPHAGADQTARHHDQPTLAGHAAPRKDAHRTPASSAGNGAGVEGGLTKNQKKKLKRKQKKRGAGGPADRGGSVADSENEGPDTADGGADEDQQLAKVPCYGPQGAEGGGGGREQGASTGEPQRQAETGTGPVGSQERREEALQKGVSHGGSPADAESSGQAGAGGGPRLSGGGSSSRRARERTDAAWEAWKKAADLRCKIVDLGNACWTYKQFTSEIQTRQYR